jgi:hypothetical protein
MRPILALAAAALALALSAYPALAGPTCVDRGGEMIRCATPGAMPVGWDLPGQQRDRLAARGDDPGMGKLIGLIGFLGGIFALIALLPDFEGRWDSQATDDEERG